MILKNKIFFILPFIIACFVHGRVYSIPEITPIVECSQYDGNRANCLNNLDYCEWEYTSNTCVNKTSGTDPYIDDPGNCSGYRTEILCKRNGCVWSPSPSGTSGMCVSQCLSDYYADDSVCKPCPATHPHSHAGSTSINHCQNECQTNSNNPALIITYPTEVPCKCLTSDACELDRCANDSFFGCSSCDSGTYLDTYTHTCKSCPDNFPNSDAGAIGTSACYQSCDACDNASANPLLSHIGPWCEQANGDKVYNDTGSAITECEYRYNCAAGYYSNVFSGDSSSAVECYPCDNLPTNATYDDTIYENGHETDEGAILNGECPWILTCPAGHVYDEVENKCKQCPDAAPVSWYKNTNPQPITYRFDGSYISATDGSGHNGTEQNNNLPYCDGNVFTVTLNHAPNNEIITNLNDLKTAPIYFKYDDPSGQMWYNNPLPAYPIKDDNKLKTPISWGDFNGYYIHGTNTLVFDANGDPVNNPQIITANVTLDAHYATPNLTYYAKIVAGEGVSNANLCPGACSQCLYTGNDSQCELPQYNNNNSSSGVINYDGYDITFGTNNRYEARDNSNNLLGYIQRDSQSNNILTFVPTTVEALSTMRSSVPYIYIYPKLCPAGYYCQNFTKTQCPAGKTTDAGAKLPTDCKVVTTFTRSTKFKDTNLSQSMFFYLPIATNDSVKMATKLQNKLNGE